MPLILFKFNNTSSHFVKNNVNKNKDVTYFALPTPCDFRSRFPLHPGERNWQIKRPTRV